MVKKKKKPTTILTKSLGSSETTREPTLSPFIFNFDYFIENYQPEHLSNRPKQDTVHFLEWFVGFSEGDCCFERRISDGRLRLSFTIRQKDPQLLYKVKAGLGFGTVREDHSLEGLYQFTVEDKTGIRRLMTIFNGNLILPKVHDRYESWVKRATFWPDFQLSKQVISPSLKTAWISGFTEAEGCFYAVLTTPSPRSLQKFRLGQKFTLTQKHVLGEKKVLEQIRDLFESENKLSTSKPDSFRVEINSIKSQQLVADYFKKFPLKGKKRISCLRWWRILLLRTKEVHYDKLNEPKLRRLVSSLNKSTKKQVNLKEKIQE